MKACVIDLSLCRYYPVQGGKAGKVGQGYKFSSVGSRFKRQLADLMEALHRMEPHYIRCIKPNSFNRYDAVPCCAATAKLGLSA